MKRYRSRSRVVSDEAARLLKPVPFHLLVLLVFWTPMLLVGPRGQVDARLVAESLSSPTSFTLYAYPPGQVSPRIPEALWQDGVDTSGRTFSPNTVGSVGPQAVTVGPHGVAYVSRGQLVMRDSKSGRTLWRSGSNLMPAIFQGRGAVFAARNDGTIFAFSANSGRPLWSTRSAPRDIDEFTLMDQLLLANSIARGFVGLDPRTGARWRVNIRGFKFWSDGFSLGPRVSAQGVIIFLAMYGEPMQETAIAIDSRDGRILWKHSDWFPISVSKGLVYLRDHLNDPTREDQFEVNARDIRTGKARKTFSYTLHSTDPLVVPRYQRALIVGQDVYVDMGCAVYRLRLGQPGRTIYRIRGDACRTTINAQGQGRAGETGWLAGPYRGHLFLWDGRNLYSLDLTNGKTKTYPAVRSTVSRLVLAGNRIYVGQLDGWFRILDLNSGAELFRVRMGARNFDFKVSSGIILVQAENRLVAFRAR